MNKILFWCGVALFVIGLSILVITGNLPEDIFHFGPWFWIALAGWLMLMLSFAFGPDEE